MTQEVEVIEEGFNTPISINVKTLAKRWSPFRETIWQKCDTPITPQEVFEALMFGELISPDVPKQMHQIWDVSPREDHVGRIAWFVENYDPEQAIVSIDFGIPTMGYGFEFIDGNHRLAAAIYLQKERILCDWQGALTELRYFANFDAETEQAPWDFLPRGKAMLGEHDPNFVSRYCEGETCHCGQPSVRKIEESIQDDDPYQARHPYTQYVCQLHFDKALRPYLFVSHDSNEYKTEA